MSTIFGLFWSLAPFLFVLLLVSLKQINQYERGIKFTMGRFSGTVEPGWRIVIPVFQSLVKMDMRLKALDVPSQDAITKDNVSAKINAVIYYRVADTTKAVLEVENVHWAVMQLAQTTMRNIVGEVTLDELLSQRQVISEKIEQAVEKATSEAERERRAVIINAEGEVAAAENLSKAANILAQTPGALHLRTLNSINDISSDASNTVVFTLPLEIRKAFAGYKDGQK